VVNTIRHGWMFELDGASWATAKDSSSNARGTVRGRNLRVECRSLTSWSKFSIVVFFNAAPARGKLTRVAREKRADWALEGYGQTVRDVQAFGGGRFGDRSETDDIMKIESETVHIFSGESANRPSP
jgi:hypothetical protein